MSTKYEWLQILCSCKLELRIVYQYICSAAPCRHLGVKCRMQHTRRAASTIVTIAQYNNTSFIHHGYACFPAMSSSNVAIFMVCRLSLSMEKHRREQGRSLLQHLCSTIRKYIVTHCTLSSNAARFNAKDGIMYGIMGLLQL